MDSRLDVVLLAVHETAEEEVVHPYARKNVAGGEEIVRLRLGDVESAKEVLSRLEDMDVDSAEFLERFAALRQDVLAHAEAEERYEFAHFRTAADRGKLETPARAVRAAESVAPTRPHPGVADAGGRRTGQPDGPDEAIPARPGPRPDRPRLRSPEGPVSGRTTRPAPGR
ncbi:hypothetical protein OH768_23600 [Streptomyces sp. NBC_01622]|uniref:hemerythrin domain-containing protein n=1 Tax=Streptomyces sp. NBC_01622 TaxID=2975903 RepID=UPI003864F05B|nr:hypothetical protein OH768_23600 [Streptomyces sp. NBC_01622]